MTHYSRTYTDEDLPALQNALAQWIQEAGDLGYCHVGDIPHCIYNGMRGRFPLNELVHVWYIGTAIIGIVITEPHYECFNVFVSPAQKGGLLEQEMLEQGYVITRHYMDKIGLGDKAVMCDVHRNDTKRIQSLETISFEYNDYGHNIAEINLSEAISKPDLPNGFTLRSATLDDCAELAAVHNSAFTPCWTPELYRDEVMLKSGYAPERELVIVSDTGEIVAFAVTWLDEINKVGLFEPVGVHQNFQRRGFGQAIMLYGLHEMKRLGMKTAKVTHGIKNEASTDLYHSLGFQTKHEIMEYKKA